MFVLLETLYIVVILLLKILTEGFTIGQPLKKMETEEQTVKTLTRVLGAVCAGYAVFLVFITSQELRGGRYRTCLW